jgi:DNA-binding transcriptional MerR regulator
MAKRLIAAGEVQKLTGLSADQLREWTNRRGLIKPDVQPHGPGSKALYSWQTVLLLRLAIVFKDTFHIELQAQRDLFAALAQRFAKRPIHALRGSALILQAEAHYDIVPLSDLRTVEADSLVIRLDPHLDALSTDFGMMEPTAQLPLFAAVAVR